MVRRVRESPHKGTKVKNFFYRQYDFAAFRRNCLTRHGARVGGGKTAEVQVRPELQSAEALDEKGRFKEFHQK